MVDATDLKSVSEWSVGSSPISRTRFILMPFWWNGIHDRFKNGFRKDCGFESHERHQIFKSLQNMR